MVRADGTLPPTLSATLASPTRQWISVYWNAVNETEYWVTIAGYLTSFRSRGFPFEMRWRRKAETCYHSPPQTTHRDRRPWAKQMIKRGRKHPANNALASAAPPKFCERRRPVAVCLWHGRMFCWTQEFYLQPSSRQSGGCSGQRNKASRLDKLLHLRGNFADVVIYPLLITYVAMIKTTKLLHTIKSVRKK